MYLFFDTESTGKADFCESFTAPHQPNLVQLAARLCTEEGQPVQSFSFIVKPDGWEIPDEAAAIHGLTTEFCVAHGLPLTSVLQAFKMLCRRADKIVAYNMKFDSLVIRTAYHRSKIEHDLSPLAFICAMEPMTDICKIPNEWGSFKWPKLIEAHQFLFGEGFDGAHDAMADVDAMIRVFFEVQRRRKNNEI